MMFFGKQSLSAAAPGGRCAARFFTLSVKLARSSLVLAAATALSWAEEPLPLPSFEPALPLPSVQPLPEVPQEAPARLMKPTISIKPPSAPKPATPVTARSVAAQPQVTLKRLIVMQGPVDKKIVQPDLLPVGRNGPVTVLGMKAPQETIKSLESFFGVEMNESSEKKLLDAVRKGLAGSQSSAGKVEKLGWWPQEGVMAVAVYPGS